MSESDTNGRDEARLRKLLHVVFSPSCAAGEKANACDALAALYRKDPDLAGVELDDPDDEEGDPWYKNVTMSDVQVAVSQADQLAELFQDWVERRRDKNRGR